MAKEYTIDMAKYVVRTETGAIDADATRNRFDNDFSQFVAVAEQDEANIGVAVEAVFDRNLGQRLVLQSVVTFTLQEMGCTINKFSEMSEKVEDYIRNHKTVYDISRGKNGGCARICDIPPKKE